MTENKERRFGIMRRFARDERGVGAIEFAILFPVLLLLYLGAFQLTVGLSVSKRASRSAGSIADIVSQQTAVSKAVLATMPSVAGAIFAPYTTSGLTLKLTGINVDSTGKATIAWSWSQSGTAPYTAGSSVTVPANMNQASTFLVRSELSIPYQLISFGSNFLPNGSNQITINRQYYYRQRGGTSISCSDC
ncbi:pilus assembly protein [Rhizobium sp. P38BS-XIX]|uniref:TadE/TadG family type IV pilus assembly protein n=1 Tax=Rhizobium sp. P38BS-XIX TaxID=2726740 RepID=UPI0014576B1F|nr:TadE/TadG family type IV pilus assembly protein [Rhizobium sp. P38BS-XIX]NLR98548.1 pilus assembly protein [Rhizobium sp. P38BS-XIX]